MTQLLIGTSQVVSIAKSSCWKSNCMGLYACLCHGSRDLLIHWFPVPRLPLVTAVWHPVLFDHFLSCLQSFFLQSVYCLTFDTAANFYPYLSCVTFHCEKENLHYNLPNNQPTELNYVQSDRSKSVHHWRYWCWKDVVVDEILSWWVSWKFHTNYWGFFPSKKSHCW